MAEVGEKILQEVRVVGDAVESCQTRVDLDPAIRVREVQAVQLQLSLFLVQNQFKVGQFEAVLHVDTLDGVHRSGHLNPILQCWLFGSL